MNSSTNKKEILDDMSMMFKYVRHRHKNKNNKS